MKVSTIDLLTLPRLAAGQHLALLLLRLVTGAFLIHGVWDNIESAARMDEFARFLAKHRFPLPAVMAPLSVWAQFFCGVCFVFGALTRWAGLVCVFNFVVACLLVHFNQDLRGWWPALVLVLIGLLLATLGPGRHAVDTWLLQRRRETLPD